MDEQESDEQLLANGLTFDGGKKGQIYVVDYGEHMFQGEGDKQQQRQFRLALQTVRDQINQQCCSGDMNELGSVIFFNTTRTKTSRESIECIFVHRELGTFDADYVKLLDELLAKEDLLAEMQSELGPSGICDWGDVILVCQDVLQSIKALHKKVINIFTTDNAEFIDSNSLKGAKKRVLEELVPKNVEIKVFLLEEDKDEETEFTKFLKAISPEMERYTNFDQLREGLHFKNYSLRSTTSVPFILGEEFQFAVGIYFLIKPLGIPAAILMDSETNEKIEQRSHYIPKDKEIVEENTQENPNLIPGAVEGEVFEGEVNFMRNVGGVDIVLSREELENLRRFDQPGITLIGFKPMKLLKDSHRMSPAKFIHPLDNVISGSSKLYRALLNRCLQRQLFILVRYTQKLNTPPQLCALVPQSNTNEHGNLTVNSSYVYEGFHLLELPFAEEARNLRDRYGPPPDGLGKWPSPDDQKIKAAKEFVRKLTKGYTPDQFANPVLQRHYKGVETLALDLSMDSFEGEVSKLDALQPYFLNPANVNRVANKIAKLRELCSSSASAEGEKDEKPPPPPKKGGGRAKKKEAAAAMEIDDGVEEEDTSGPSTKRTKRSRI